MSPCACSRASAAADAEPTRPATPRPPARPPAGLHPQLLLDLARAAGLQGKVADMFSGKHINSTEDRAVLHVALRAPREAVSAPRTPCCAALRCWHAAAGPPGERDSSTPWLLAPGCRG